MKSLLTCFAVFAVCTSPLAIADESPTPSRFARRWIYAHPGFDLRNEDGTQQMIDLITRAQRAGYNGVNVLTGPLELLSFRQPDAYYLNMERVRLHAESLNIELIPTVMRVNGYANGILSNNPNLAPGMPVKECLMTVRDGQAMVADRANIVTGGDFEAFDAPDRPNGWDWLDLPGKASFEDREVFRNGKASLRFEHFQTASEHGNCRLFKRLQLKPWHQYHLRFFMKTLDVPRPESLEVKVHGNVDQKDRRNLQYRTIDAKGTQDWTQHDVVFNTLDNSEVWLYIGGWAPAGGKIWIDDVTLRQVAGINLLRRDGCPIRVTSEDGSQIYFEGEDFEKWEYSKMGRVRWPGQYEIAHAEPPLVLTSNSRIRDRQTLKVSFYHTLMHMNAGMGICLSQDEVFQYLEQHLEIVKKLLRPKTYIMVQDEVRLAGWCECCNPPGQSTGQVLARCTRRCADIIRRIDPGAEIVSWSDMFDPFHNAVDRYWLTRDTMKGSWEGLDRDIWIGNWNHHHTKDSLGFFAKRGHRQLLATYYDRSDWQQFVRGCLNASQDVPKIDGIIYTTWANDLRHLEEFMKLVNSPEPQPSPTER